MPEFQDLFSSHAGCYARARPGYPSALFDFLAAHTSPHRLAWDCGTGNGQAAVGLADHFERVVATDASAAQLAVAAPHERVMYRVGRAEDCDLDASCVNLVTAANALHWLDLEAFYRQVRRVGAPGCVLAAWCYGLARVDPHVDAAVLRLFDRILGPYWSPARRWVDERYRTIPFPFRDIDPIPEFSCRLDWTLATYRDFLASWSAAQRFREHRGRDPLDDIERELATAWGTPEGLRTVTWPLYLRIGIVHDML